MADTPTFLPNNSKNFCLKPGWEVYRKRGRGWEYLGIYHEKSDQKAAYRASYVHNIKVIGVRPEDSRDKIRVFRLLHVASLSYA